MTNNPQSGRGRRAHVTHFARKILDFEKLYHDVEGAENAGLENAVNSYFTLQLHSSVYCTKCFKCNKFRYLLSSKRS